MRDAGPDEVLCETALGTTQGRHAGQPQGVVRHDQIDPALDGLGRDPRGRIDRQQNRLDRGIRITEGQAHRIPRLGQIRRKPPLELGHHISQPHVGPAGLEPTTFPV